MKNIINKFIVIIYFIIPMSFVLLLLLIMPFMFVSDVKTVLESGFAGPTSAFQLIAVMSFSIGLSMTIPTLRVMYHFFPWLYSFIVLFFINFIILNIGLVILNYGYEVDNENRHRIFLILMIGQIVLSRLAMSLYFKYRPLPSIKEEYNG